MTQPQLQQKRSRYDLQRMIFADRLGKIHPDYFWIARSVPDNEGLEAAIVFCEAKILESQIMQAYRDLEMERC